MESDKGIEEAAKAIHDKEIHPGAWDNYDTWQYNTEVMHEKYREMARVAFTVFKRNQAIDELIQMDFGGE